MKKMVSALLVLAMVLSMGIPGVSAASGTAPDTLYIDIAQVARANETPDGVYLWVNTAGGGQSVTNELMTHVSGTVYSYDLSSVASSAVSVEFAINYETPATYSASFSAGKNLYIPSNESTGLWGVYTGNSKKTHNVTGYYTPSPQAEITGMYITVDGTKITSNTAENPVTIYSDSVIEVTLRGVNFDKIAGYTESSLAFAWFGGNINKLFADENSGWTIDTTKHTATLSTSAAGCTDILSQATEAKELKYTNNCTNDEEAIASGIYVIYNSGKRPSAVITGVEITIDGTTYTKDNTSKDQPAKITPNSNVTIVILGTNLDKLTTDDLLRTSPAVSIIPADRNGSTNETNTRLTVEIIETSVVGGFQAATEVYELAYTDKGITAGSDEYTGLGVYIIYNDRDAKTASVTGVSVKVGDQTYTSGNVTLTATSGDVTLILSGENLDKLDANKNLINYRNIYDGVNRIEFTVDGNTATKTVSATVFSDHTTAFEIKYSNDGGTTWIGSGIYIVYQTSTTSVEITWGALSFTYSDEKNDNGEEKGWTCENGADKIKVTNIGTVEVTITVTYKAADESSPISVALDKQSATLAKDAYETFNVTLTGKPTGAMTNQSIGTVTVKIGS